MSSPFPEPSSATAVMRGLTRRCPRCGRGKLFPSWFKMVPECPRCTMPLERDRASFLGSASLNYGVTGLVFVMVLGISVALTVPDVPILPIFLISTVVAIITPLVGFPFSKTLWAAFEYLAHRSG